MIDLPRISFTAIVAFFSCNTQLYFNGHHVVNVINNYSTVN